MVLPGGSFEDACDGNLESAGPEEVDPLVNSEGTRVSNELGIYDGEGLGITLGLVDRRNLAVDE